MTDKELKRLGRTELLELLLCQTRRAERLQTKLETAQAQLRRREIAIGEAGTLAEAALALSGIFAAAAAGALGDDADASQLRCQHRQYFIRFLGFRLPQDKARGHDDSVVHPLSSGGASLAIR